MAEKPNKKDELSAMFRYNQEELRIRRMDEQERTYIQARYQSPPNIYHMNTALTFFRANIDLSKKTPLQKKQIDTALKDFDIAASKLSKGQNSEFDKGKMLAGKFVFFRNYLSADNPNYNSYIYSQLKNDPDFKKWCTKNVRDGIFKGSRIAYGKVCALLDKKLIYLKSLCSETKDLYEQESID